MFPALPYFQRFDIPGGSPSFNNSAYTNASTAWPSSMSSSGGMSYETNDGSFAASGTTYLGVSGGQAQFSTGSSADAFVLARFPLTDIPPARRVQLGMWGARDRTLLTDGRFIRMTVAAQGEQMGAVFTEGVNSGLLQDMYVDVATVGVNQSGLIPFGFDYWTSAVIGFDLKRGVIGWTAKGDMNDRRTSAFQHLITGCGVGPRPDGFEGLEILLSGPQLRMNIDTMTARYV